MTSYQNKVKSTIKYINMAENKKEKPKRTNLTILQRLEIINKLNDKISMTILAREYGVTKATISRIKSAKDNILANKRILTDCHGNLRKKKYNGVEGSLLEQEVYKWFIQEQNTGIPISGAAIQGKAREFNRQIYGNDNFKASAGWLDKFKNRHGIRLTTHNKKIANCNIIDDFKLKLTNLVQIFGVGSNQIYNCDETGLYWRLLPNRSENEDSSEKKSDMLTVMLCTNATGTHKLPLYIIGKHQDSNSLKGIEELPVIYRQKNDALMDSNLMKDWYVSVFLPEIRGKHNLNENKKAILIMDNAPCHLSEDEFNKIANYCMVCFLPPKVASSIHPMTHGIIEKFKNYYKQLLVKTMLYSDVNNEIKNSLKSFSLLNCSHFCSVSWSNISRIDIQNCWKNLISIDDSSNRLTTFDANAFHQLITDITNSDEITEEAIDDWLTADAAETGWEQETKNETVKVTVENSENIEPSCSYASDDESSDESDFIKVESHEAFHAINTLISFYQEDEKCNIFIPTLIELSEDITQTILITNRH